MAYDSHFPSFSQLLPDQPNCWLQCLSQWVSCVSCSVLGTQGSWPHACHHPGPSHCITMQWGVRGWDLLRDVSHVACYAPLMGSCVTSAAETPTVRNAMDQTVLCQAML